MIVNYTANGWEIITQRAHGILAAQVASHWNPKRRPGRWMETLLAIAEHDDAEVELDGETLLTASGGPLNFSMKQFDLPHCEKLAMLTLTKSRYISLLTSLHMDFLYRKEEHDNKAARAFLQEQRKLQTDLRKALGMEESEMKRIYYLLEWCDAFSLILCQRQVQPEKRSIEVSTGPDQVTYHLLQTGEKELTVDPWPFDINTFTVYFESRLIQQLQFEDAAAFREAFVKAAVMETTWEIVKKSSNIKKPAKI
ncbi:MAG: DUF3891 family protein [Chitinophagaceae bacterium]